MLRVPATPRWVFWTTVSWPSGRRPTELWSTKVTTKVGPESATMDP